MTHLVTRAVTANVRSGLDGASAGRCLSAALDLEPDVLGLQEWRIGRWLRLRASGPVRVAGTPVRLPGDGPMTWVAGSLGDCVVGLRTDRYTVLGHRQVLLALPGPADRGTGRPGLLPPRWATSVEAHDDVLGQRVGVVAFHLVPGAQGAGRYRADRPRTAAQHGREVSALAGLVTSLRARCDTVWALGDSNFHGLELPGLYSAWDGVAGSCGTMTSYRRVDDVFGPGPSSRVEMYVTESDHRMVLAERVDALRSA